MDARDILLVCGDRRTEGISLKIRRAVMRDMEIRTNHDFDRPMIRARPATFARRDAMPFLIPSERLAA